MPGGRYDLIVNNHKEDKMLLGGAFIPPTLIPFIKRILFISI